MPEVFNLRTDPYERADITSNTYWDWLIDRAFLIMAAQPLVAKTLETMKEFFPPRQKLAAFSLDDLMKTLTAGVPSA